MNQPSRGERGGQAEQPQDKEDDDDRRQHVCSFVSATIVRHEHGHGCTVVNTDADATIARSATHPDLRAPRVSN
jgi:hypothetical protein